MLDTPTAGTGIEPSCGAEQGRERQGAVGLFTVPRRKREQGRRDCAQEQHQKYR